MKAIRLTNEIDVLVVELKTVSDALALARRKKKIEQERSPVRLNFGSRAEVANRLDQAILELSRSSFEFGDMMRRWISEIVIYPVQALDSGLVRPRARVSMAWPTESIQNGIEAAGARPENASTTLDLFDSPVHIQHLRACLAEKKRNPSLSLKGIAEKLGINHMTVKRAFDYQRLMQQAGIDEPYRELHSEPRQASRWRKRSSHSGSEPQGDKSSSAELSRIGKEGTAVGDQCEKQPTAGKAGETV